MWRMIKHTFLQSLMGEKHKEKLQEQINLYWALLDYWEVKKEEKDMASIRSNVREKINNKQDWEFEEKEECYYATGQAISYLISKSKAKMIPASEINTFLNVKNGDQLAKKLIRLYKKYNYRIEAGLRGNERFQRAFARVEQALGKWSTIDPIWLVAGFADSNLFYEKVEKKDDVSGEGGKDDNE